MAELTPYLCVVDARKAVEWYVSVLGATVTDEPVVMDDQRIGHVELSIDGAPFMMADEFPEVGVEGPDGSRGTAVTLHLTVADVEALAAAVVDAGVSLDRGPETTDHGRVVVFRDPFHHRWYVTEAS